MAQIVSIISATDVLKCAAGSSCSVGFTITNTANRRIHVGIKARPSGETMGQWLKVENGSELELDRNATENVTTKITLPNDVKAGTYSFHVCVYELDAPDENYTDSHPIVIDVTAPPAVEKKEEKSFPWWIPVSVIGVLIILVTATALLWPEAEIAVPNVIGQTRDKAIAVLTEAGLAFEEQGQMGTGKPIGEVVDQNPVATTPVAPKTVVTLVVAAAQPTVSVPNVVSLPYQQAVGEIESRGLKAARKETPKSCGPVNPELVLSQNPAPLSAVAQGSTVTMEVAAAIPLPYGPDTCKQGYVWREAFPGDHVCVTPDVRQRVWSDNSQAAQRVQPGGGAYGPDTCKQGYVWREARPGDHVCVTGELREQTRRDNSLAAERRVCP